MSDDPTEIFGYAVKLLAQRDYSIASLREKLQKKFTHIPDDVIQQLIAKRYLNEKRFAENHVGRHHDRGPIRLKQELLSRGIPEQLINDVLSRTEWPSLRAVLKAKMDGWHVRVPLQPTDAARLFRALARLGYEEDAIREEIEQLQHEQ